MRIQSEPGALRDYIHHYLTECEYLFSFILSLCSKYSNRIHQQCSWLQQSSSVLSEAVHQILVDESLLEQILCIWLFNSVIETLVGHELWGRVNEMHKFIWEVAEYKMVRWKVGCRSPKFIVEVCVGSIPIENLTVLLSPTERLISPALSYIKFDNSPL